ncbi:MAG: hypothetical protein HY262_05915 [Chloroflexi bacterium]|nr:hypothetical protein [Chloroflexota bacterium]
MTNRDTSCCGTPDTDRAASDQTKPAKTTSQAGPERAAELERISPERGNSGLFQAVRRLLARPQA